MPTVNLPLLRQENAVSMSALAVSSAYLAACLLYSISTVPLSLSVLWLMLGALGEEVIFRRFLYGLLRKRLSVRVAMVVSSAVFAAVHSNSFHFLYFFGMGLLLSLIYVVCKSVWPGAIFHGAENLLTNTIRSPAWQPQEIMGAQLTGDAIFGFLIMVKITVAVGLYIYATRKKLFS